MMFLFDIAMPGGGTTAIGIGAVFFLFLAGIAYIAFRLLKRTVRMAFRMAIVSAILLIAIVGGISLWWLNSGSSGRPKPGPTRSR